MRSTSRSVDIGGTDEPLTATSPRYFTVDSVDGLLGAPHVLTTPFHVVALGVYRGELRRAVHAMKYRNHRWLAARFGAHLARAVRASGSQWRPDTVTWAPTTPARVRLRGHDQSALIAVSLARQLRVRSCRTLRRYDDRVRTGAGRTQRAIAPLYAVRRRAVRGRRVLLVDDVMTTGTTLRAARLALLDAGASEVRCAVIAHVRPWIPEG